MSQSPVPNASPLPAEALTTIAGLTASSYVLGFIIINAYLVSQVLIGYTLLNSKYLAAGICFAFFYLLAGFVFVVLSNRPSLTQEWNRLVKDRENTLNQQIHLLRDQGKSDAHIKGYTFSYRRFFTMSYAVAYVATITIGNIGYYILFLLFCIFIFLLTSSYLSLIYSPMMYLWVILVTLGTWIGIDLVQSSKKFPVVLAAWFLIFLFVSAIIYGTHLYPRISSSIGGGTPVSASLVIDTADTSEVEATLGVKLIDNKTPELQFIVETPEAFVIRIDQAKGRRICQLNKELIQGIIYNKAKI
jgi:hypothetical protein